MNPNHRSRLASTLLCLSTAAAFAPPFCAEEATQFEPRVLYSHTVRKADGGLLIFQRIEAPAVVAAPVAPSGPGAPLPMFAAGAEIYEGSLSEVTWRHEGRRYKARSSVDFRLLTGTGAFGEGAQRRNLMLSMSAQSRARFDAEAARLQAAGMTAKAWPVFAPELLASVPAGMRAWFVVVESEGTPEQEAAACVAMEALHAYIDAHWDALHAARAQREADAAALAAWKAAHPEPVVKDTVIRFWPVQSSLNLLQTPGSRTQEVKP